MLSVMVSMMAHRPSESCLIEAHENKIGSDPIGVIVLSVDGLSLFLSDERAQQICDRLGEVLDKRAAADRAEENPEAESRDLHAAVGVRE